MDKTAITRNALNKLAKDKEVRHLLVGFDGFVDEIIHVVDQRTSVDAYKRIRSIGDFAERIASVAGLSANIELVPTQTKLGGNGPIMANAIIEQGHQVSYVGALGKEHINPVFHELTSRCRRVISLANPGHTDALEFSDGKLMLGKMDKLSDVHMDALLEQISVEALTDLLSEIHLVAFTNWTMLPNLGSIMEGFGNIFDALKKNPLVFIDLADPKKRTDEDIDQVLKKIAALPAQTILSMNQSESTIIARILTIEEENLQARAEKIRNAMDIHGIVIHPVDGAAMAYENGSVWVDGPYTEEPQLTTGAGDNFNAGFCNAWIKGLSPSEALMAGVCTSGFYVRHARSPRQEELLEFMEQWMASGFQSI